MERDRNRTRNLKIKKRGRSRQGAKKEKDSQKYEDIQKLKLYVIIEHLSWEAFHKVWDPG